MGTSWYSHPQLLTHTLWSKHLLFFSHGYYAYVRNFLWKVSVSTCTLVLLTNTDKMGLIVGDRVADQLVLFTSLLNSEPLTSSTSIVTHVLVHRASDPGSCCSWEIVLLRLQQVQDSLDGLIQYWQLLRDWRLCLSCWSNHVLSVFFSLQLYLWAEVVCVTGCGRVLGVCGSRCYYHFRKTSHFPRGSCFCCFAVYSGRCARAHLFNSLASMVISFS